nr:unnamed protein product [Callosobruchus chinensis]
MISIYCGINSKRNIAALNVQQHLVWRTIWNVI